MVALAFPTEHPLKDNWEICKSQVMLQKISTKISSKIFLLFFLSILK